MVGRIGEVEAGPVHCRGRRGEGVVGVPEEGGSVGEVAVPGRVSHVLICLQVIWIVAGGTYQICGMLVYGVYGCRD